MKNFDRCVIILSTPQYRGSTRFGCEKAFTYRYPLLRFSLKSPDLCGRIQPEPLAPGIGDGDCSFRSVGVVQESCVGLVTFIINPVLVTPTRLSVDACRSILLGGVSNDRGAHPTGVSGLR